MKDKPLPPEVLADALQDRPAPSSGRLRYSSPVTRKERRMLNERDRLRRLYENLLEVTDETAQQPVDIELALNLCRQLSSGRAALISDLDAQVATLTTALAMTKTILAETQIDATQAEMTLREELATAKREAVEAFCAAVKKRDAALVAQLDEWHQFDHLHTALDDELARIREE